MSGTSAAWKRRARATGAEDTDQPAPTARARARTPSERARHALATRDAVLSVSAAGREQLRAWRQTGMGATPEARHVRARLLSRLGVAVRLGRGDEAREARTALRRFDARMRQACEGETAGAIDAAATIVATGATICE